MLWNKISEDLKEAMKAKDEARVSILRMVHAALKNKKIELLRELTDEDVMSVLRTLIKQYRDSVLDFRRGGRDDLASKTENEIKILEVYLPKAPTEDEIRKVVKKKKDELGASGASDFGRLMGVVMKEIGAGAGGDAVSKIVREELA